MCRKLVTFGLLCYVLLMLFSGTSVFAVVTVITDSEADFSSVQGQNGWSYYDRHWADPNWHPMTWDGSYWNTDGVQITATTQSSSFGDTYFTKREWVADQAYTDLTWSFSYTMGSCGNIKLVHYMAATETEEFLWDDWYPQESESQPMTGIVSVAAGDTIYIMVDNGDGTGWPVHLTISTNIITDSEADFSSVQGQAGWTYYNKYFADPNWTQMTWNETNSEWEENGVYIEAASQNSNAYWTKRQWMADKAYTDLRWSFTYTMTGAPPIGNIKLVVNQSGTETVLLDDWYPQETIVQPLTGVVSLAAGDTMYIQTTNGDGYDWPVNLTLTRGLAYYIDSVNGNDSNNGLSENSAWQTFTNVNNMAFCPGDKILLKAGSSFDDALQLRGSGQENYPITVDMYSTGDKPLLHRGLFMINEQYWEVNNLEFDLLNDPDRGYASVHVIEMDYGIAHHLHFTNIDISDVNAINDGGGFLFVNGQESGTQTWYDDLLIENCTITHCNRNGILLTSYPGMVSPNSTNVVIRNNTINDIGGNGLYIIGCKGALIEYNTIHYTHQRETIACAGLWPMTCDDTLIQYNEVSHTAVGGPVVWDSEGFDCDVNCNNTTYQYNYSHDNRGGFLLICGGANNTIARYNISQNDGTATFTAEFGATNVDIYNNIIYVGPGNTVNMTRNLIHDPNFVQSDFNYYNNIFYVDGTMTYDFGAITNINFSNNNLYGNHSNPPTDPYPVTGNPLLVDAGSGGNGMDTLDGYKIIDANSPCINTGKFISNDGGLDFWSNKLPEYLYPDVGAYSYSRFFEHLASNGFSDTQGANGWSYAAVSFTGDNDLATNQVPATYDSNNSEWCVVVPGAGTVYIDANSQDMTEGYAVRSLRYWTADQYYDSIDIISTLYATVTCGACVKKVDAATLTTTDVSSMYWSSDAEISAGGGVQAIDIDCSLTDIKQGDSIYFVLQNSGDGQGSNVMQVWDPAIIAVPDTTPPEAPTNLSATAGNGIVSLDWLDNTEPDLMDYNVYRSTTGGNNYVLIASGVSASDYLDNTVTNGTTYYYIVTAVDTSSNESTGSIEASATPQLPPTIVFSDSFEVNEWNGLWTEGGQNDWFRSTQRSVDGSYSAEVDGYASDAMLTSVDIDLQGRSNATITFSWLVESGLDSGEYLAFDVSTNGSSNWTQKAILQGNVDSENVWHNESIDVVDISSGSLMIRFRGNMSRSNEDADVDMVEVLAW